MDDGGFPRLGDFPPRGRGGAPPAARGILRFARCGDAWALPASTRAALAARLTWADVPQYDPGRDNPPPREQAVLGLTEAGDRWKRDTMVVLDIRHRAWFVGIRGHGRVAFHVFSLLQPFSDHDLTWFDSEAGSVGVVRRSVAAGEVQVFEVVAPGDTAWRRRVLVPAVPLTGERAEAAIRDNLSLVPSADETEGLTDAGLRRIVEEAMFIPGHLPTVLALVATASGEVWLRTPEVARGRTVWYSVRRGDDGVPARRVLLPSTFKLQDEAPGRCSLNPTPPLRYHSERVPAPPPGWPVARGRQSAAPEPLPRSRNWPVV